MSSRLRGLELGLSGARTWTHSCCLSIRVGTFHVNVGRQICRRSLSRDASAKATAVEGGFSTEKEGDHQLQIDIANKTINTINGPLPLSPLMDSSFHEARERFEKPKSPESSTQTKTKFQRLLERNPYGMLLVEAPCRPKMQYTNTAPAQALATPIRTCGATEVVLPRYFLQDFNLVSHPETGRPWWISPSLLPDQKPGAPTDQASSLQEDGPASPEEPVGEKRILKGKKPAGPTGYVLSRQDLLKEFQLGPRSPYSRANEKKLIRLNGRDRGAAKKAVWRVDMDSFVPGLMRRRIVEDILYFSRLCETEGRKYLIRCDGWQDIHSLDHRGCVLWIGPDSPSPSNGASNGPTEPGPGQFATMDIDNGRYVGKLAVHNLRTLLGNEHLAQLKEGSTILRDGDLFLLGRRRTIELQLKLWKLQGYIAKF